MKISWPGLLITAIVALAAGFAGVWLGMRAFHHPGPPGFHEMVHEELNLSADQENRIEALEAEFATRRRALELEMQAANVDLAAAIREEHGYGPRVTAAIERCHDAMGQLQAQTIRHVFAMREVLNAEQQATFDATVVAALTAAHP
ncbi:MAG: Spy/CpxP family protein refolding chaperone [Hyphomonadaceae bacterium]